MSKFNFAAFIAGSVGASGAELLKFPEKFGVDIHQFGETVNNLMESYMMHGKGAFQAIAYSFSY